MMLRARIIGAMNPALHHISNRTKKLPPLRVGYTWGNGKYEVAAYSRNITNQIRIVGGIDFNNLTGFINEPRFWGVQFKANF